MNVYLCQIFVYGMLAVPSAVVIIVWWVLIFRKYGSDISQMYIALSEAYTQPNPWHVAAILPKATPNIA